MRAHAGFIEWGDVPVRRSELAAAQVVLVVTLNGGLQVARAGSRETRLTAFVAGVGCSPITTCQAGRQASLEVQPSPPAAGAVLGMPAGELANGVVDLTDLWGASCERLVDQLTDPTITAGAGGWQQRFSVVASVLQERARRSGARMSPDPRLLRAHQEIEQRGGNLPMSSLLEITGWNRRRLATEFRRHVGLTPKALARLVRFRRAEKLLRTPGRGSLASIALECGYYDQAHLTRDFRELAGSPPTVHLTRSRADVAAAEMGAAAEVADTDFQDGVIGCS